jgi:AcrR family transcriptional regulator
MVSHRRRRATPPSRDRLLAAAADEFAARGFDGAKVERITRRARINKAMLYYHFPSKAALYQAILRDVFGGVASAVAAGRETGGPPDAQLRRFVRTVAEQLARHPQAPAIWLREMAEGGRHLDATVVREMARILQTLAAILEEGRAAGQFADVPPFVVQLGIVAPLLLFAASEPVRRRFQPNIPVNVAALAPDLVVEHVETAALAVLAQGTLRSRKGQS